MPAKSGLHVTVTKQPDGTVFVTQDGFGTLVDNASISVDGSVSVGAEGSVSVEVVDVFGEKVRVGLFSWVDYKDTSSGAPLPVGVRHTHQFAVPGGGGFGPYGVTIG